VSIAASRRTPGVGARRFGYAVAVVVNLVVLYAANVWPGWQKVPFLTAETAQVIGLVNASILVSAAVNLVYLVRDPKWLTSLGSVATSAVALAATVRVRRVFPFDFGDTSFDWEPVVRILLVLGIVGSAIAIVVGLVGFVQALRAL
jgi:hypothetical protein